MFFVYVLENSEKKLYFGYTNNLKRRLSEHKRGETFSTKGSDYDLIYYEAYKSQNDALRRERQLKNYGQAWAQTKKRFSDSRQHES